MLKGWRFQPLGVRPSDTPALTVYVEGGWYRFEGNWKAFEGADSGSLSGYLPDAGVVCIL